MDKEFWKKKVLPIALIVVVSFFVVHIVYTVLFWFKGLYFVWLLYVLWWLALLFVVQRALRKKYGIQSLYEGIRSIKSKKLRIGVVVLLLIPIAYASTKGLARDVRLMNARALNATSEMVYEMVLEAAEKDKLVVDRSKIKINNSVSDLLDGKIEVEVDGKNLTLYRDKKYVFRYGALRSYSDWTAVWDD